MDRKVKTLLKGAGLERLIGGELPVDMRQRAIENKQQARTLEEAKYQAWLKEHGKTDTTANLQGDEAIMSRSTDPTYQQYRREQEQARYTPEALTSKATADIEEAKKKLADPMYNLEGKINLKEAKAFGLPRDAKFKDLIAAFEAAKASGGLNQNQQNYSGRAEAYKSFTARANQSVEAATGLQKGRVEAANKDELKRLGLQEGATPEMIANARAGEAGKLKEQYFNEKAAKERLDEWRSIEASENKRIKEQMFEAKKFLRSKLTDDKVANLDWIRMDQEMVNGEYLRKQIYALQESAFRNGLETPEEYVEAYNSGKPLPYEAEPDKRKPIVIFDAEKATDEHMKELESQISFIDKVGHYGVVGGLMLADIAAEVLPYIMPAFGTALSLGWKAFAPEGSMNYQEGTVGQKFGRLGLSIVETGVKKLIGLGQQKRRKQMTKMMDDEVKLHGGARHSFTKDGLKQYKEWITRSIKIEHISLTELNNLKTILTNGTDIPASEIQKVVLEFGTDWNRAINTMVDLTQEGNSSSTIAFPPQPVRKRASGRGRGQASGFVMRMMAENKKKHKGQYKNPSTNDYGSSMKSFRAFDYSKMENPSKFLKEHFSGEPVPFVSKRAEKKAEDTALASIRASKMSQADAKAKMEEARKKIGEKPQYQILYNAFRRYVSV
jgi:hypothetical protein